MGWQVSLQEYRGGKITPDSLFKWEPLLLEAELALLDKDADAAPLYERRWRDASEVERIAERKLKQGKIAHAQAAACRWERLGAELDWLRLRGVGGKTAARAPDLFANFVAQNKEIARDKAEALRADPRQLARERLTAARVGLEASTQEFQAGHITADMVLLWTLRVFDAELALLDKGADPTSLLEWRWKTLRLIETIADVMLEAGKIDISDVEEFRSICLDAEIAWVRAWKEGGKPGDRNRYAVEGDWLDAAFWPKLKEKASRADVAGLIQERLRAAREEYRGRRLQFDAGRLTPEWPLSASRRLLEAEQAASSSPREMAAALERCWHRGLDLEAVAELKLRARKIAPADVAEVRYARLRAELRMATALPMERYSPAGDSR